MTMSCGDGGNSSAESMLATDTVRGSGVEALVDSGERAGLYRA